MLHEMFSLPIPMTEKILRPLIVYAFLLIALRIAGKRELGSLNPGDLIVLMTLSNTLQNAIIGNDNSVTGGLIGAAALLGLNSMVTRATYHRRDVQLLIEGEPTLLVQHGQIVRDNLHRELITEAELRAALRRQGIEHLDEVDQAILETGGTISVTQRHPGKREVAMSELADRLERIERMLADRLPSAGMS